MRKYLFIYKTEFINSLQYIKNLIFGSLSLILIIYVFLNLWRFLYSDPESLINGYSYTQMIWYILFTETLWSCIKGRIIVKDISNDVKSGNIAYQINKPYNYISFIFSKVFADFSFKLILLLPAALVLGRLLIGSIPNFNPIYCLIAILTGILGIIVNMLISICFGLFSFFIEDARPLYWIYSKLILVVGTLFPIEFMPKAIQPILEYSPIFALNYGPAKLFVDFNSNFLIKLLILQFIYIIIFYIITLIIYKKGVKNINVNGG